MVADSEPLTHSITSVLERAIYDLLRTEYTSTLLQTPQYYRCLSHPLPFQRVEISIVLLNSILD